MSSQIDFDMIFAFKDECLKNRVFPKCELIDTLMKRLPEFEHTVPKGFNMYRARVYTENSYAYALRIYFREHVPLPTEEVKQTPDCWEGFHAYEEKDSFANTNANAIIGNRCNNDFECCLYAAGDVTTAISEIKPVINERVSVARIVTKEELKLIDLRFNDKDAFLEGLAFLFITSPTIENKDAYIYTQVICSLIKQAGYDGIIYSSCQRLIGNNYAIFNYDKCQAVASREYEIEGIHISSKQITQ